ncbi:MULTISPECIES: hypothetical protein [unclassified Pseudomonas]|jgi:hypothetical protein|uniref:hypothetical protein n=1 Tax=unclassified Pseudomonas TaxID=196821 RepID=UPI0014822D77|nr:MULTISPECIES: hypothetical protein [unclassified Pseudomonas]UVM26246.1 hypothetical protein LOY31_22830 [Pseudomonas sp. B21-021]
MSRQTQAASNAVEIAEVREAMFDPVTGETVSLAVRVIDSGTRVAASDQEVIFNISTQPEEFRVKTDQSGWALLRYTATQVGDIAVTATLETDPTKAASHTFRFKTLAAGVWSDAIFHLNAEPVGTSWGEETRFPRNAGTHSITLRVTNPDSALLGRAFTLGLTGFSSATQLGITGVQPALGVWRTLTMTGLVWQFTTNAGGGAYNLVLGAERILKLSPENPVSLGATVPDDVADVT